MKKILLFIFSFLTLFSFVNGAYHELGTWSLPTNYPASYYGMASLGEYNGEFYFYGGGIQSVSYTSMYKYNVTSNSWTTLASGPYSLIHTKGCIIDNKAYIVGGFDRSINSIRNVLITYNIDTNTYSTSTLPFGYIYGNHVICDKDNKVLYSLGGSHGSYTNYLYKYNTASNTWTQLANIPATSYGGSGFLYNNEIYYHIGYNSGASNLIYKYNIDTNTWTQIANLPENRYYGEFLNVNNKGYYMLGYDSGGNAKNTLFEYDIDSNNWTQLNPAPYGRAIFGALSHDGYLWAFAGWTGSTTSNIVQKYYAANISSNSAIQFQNISLTNNSYINITNLNITIQLNTTNTNNNTNISYSLDNSSYIQFVTNSLNGTLELTGLTEGQHNISFYAYNNETNITSDLLYFTIDVTNPSLEVNNFTEVNSYEVNFSNLINYSDNNLDSCIITLDNSSQYNCNETINFTTNGNHTYNVSVNDLSKNKNESFNNIIFVNPFQYFNFKLSNGSIVKNYTLGNKLWNETAKFKTYNDILSFGNNNLIFEKLGYKTANITFNINKTSKINKTYEVSLAKLIITIYDKKTNQIIKGTNFTLNFIGDYGFIDSTNTGQINISKIIFDNQDYQLIISGNGYKTESKFFKFSNKEDLKLDIYLINETIVGVVYVKVVDTFGEIKKNILVQSLQWDSTKSSYILVGESKTDDNGFATLNVVLNDKLYKFRAIDNNYFVDSTSQIISTVDDGKAIVLTLTQNTKKTNLFLNDLIYNATEEYNATTNISKITFQWQNKNGNDISACVYIYQFYISGNQNLIFSNCSVNSASGSMIQSFYINSSKNIKISTGILKENSFVNLKSFIHYSNKELSSMIKDLGISYIILPLLFIVSILIGIKLNVTFGSIGVILSSGIGLYLVPDFINKSIVAFIMFIAIAMIVGGNKRK
jgi:hypothetical protein